MAIHISPMKLLSFAKGSNYELYDYGQRHVNCTAEPGYVPWIWNSFHECVTDAVEYTGFILGLLQILCWIVVMFPQFYENYKRGKMDEAIAPSFLILWMFGDLSNLVGCILTSQLPTQFATAVYYLVMDALIISQFTYYYVKNKKKKVHVLDSSQTHPAIQNGNQDHSHIIYCCTFLLSTSLLISLPWQQGQGSSPYRSSSVGRSLLSVTNGNSTDISCLLYYKHTPYCVFFDSLDIFGYVCGCLSGVFYVASRIPQLIQNYRRQSVEGVSILMFILTVTGNVFYGASILMEDTSIVFLIRHLPWLVGSLGTLFFDCIMLTQFARFRYCRSASLRAADEEDDRRKLLNGAL
nr:lysosomal amino acid transporter 1 homolog [Lytechinus pictus]